MSIISNLPNVSHIQHNCPSCGGYGCDYCGNNRAPLYRRFIGSTHKFRPIDIDNILDSLPNNSFGIFDIKSIKSNKNSCTIFLPFCVFDKYENHDNYIMFYQDGFYYFYKYIGSKS